jgi:hypothetical protein
LVSREPATRGTNGNYHAITYAVVSGTGSLVTFRAKEARGTANGNECNYTYSATLR